MAHGLIAIKLVQFFKRLFVGSLFLTSLAHADHGLDFMRLQDTSVPKPGHGVFYGNFTWDRESSSDTFETEPALYFGLTERIGFGMITAFGDEGSGWKYTSVTPYALMNLLPTDSKVFRVALWAGYQFADEGSAGNLQSMAYDSSGQSLGSMSRRESGHHADEHGHSLSRKSKPVQAPSLHAHKSANRMPPSAGGSSRQAGGHGSEGGHDPDNHSAGASSKKASHSSESHDESDHGEPQPAEQEHDHSAHDHATGIHSHGVSGLRARLIIEARISDSDKIVANLINVTPDDGNASWGYAIGFRHAFNHDVALSLEAIGDFDVEMQHQVLLAGHFSPAHWATIRVGGAVGLTEASPDFTVQTGLVLRF